MESEVKFRVGAADDWTEISQLLGVLFHSSEEEALRGIEGAVFEPERSLVATDGDVIVGHAAAYTRDLTVPGAILPAAHVTLVGVAPTHRRRGMLRQMMQRQLREVAEAGHEPIAVLWASETKIYPRFGYGMAAQRLIAEVDTREVTLSGPPPAPGSRLRMIEPGRDFGELAKVYEMLRPGRTGWSSRDDRWWRFVLADVPPMRDGATPLRGVVHETAEGPTGYAVWRTKDGWGRGGPESVADVTEVVAADPATYTALWRLLLDLDLTRTTKAHFLTLDEPLQHLVDEPRRLRLAVSDALWVRIVDLPGALARRAYRTEVDVVLEVTDTLLLANAGRWRLTGGPGGATCARTQDPADLACDVLELGAAYLGSTALSALGAAGRVRELTPGALDAASTAFGWHRMPNPTEVF
jgi:predicted acetyltransferase